ncbi:SCP-like protein [Oesophagostomum dentatum]|uniref:SCP-like protein n=1 Tax=Oesophagostomum dentatum TaxID=61180 RepID=A0A0B1RWR6_OESDE|nr:SCP-like protein [Oesophagostomum dentatum]
MSSVKAAGKKDENKICPGNKGGNDTVRMTFLNDHNKKRSSLARGLEPDPLSPTGFAPKAIRMQKMIYDCEVEASAMKHAQKCEFKHSSSGFGENLFKIDDTGRDQAGLALWADELWWGELKEIGVGPVPKITKELMARKVGHYTQVSSTIWSEANSMNF